jgi:hypothetical protein
MLGDMLVTLRRVCLGFGLAAVIGVPLGVLAACFPIVRAALGPVTIFGRNIPMAALIPLFMLAFGIDEWGKVMFLFVASVAFVMWRKRGALFGFLALAELLMAMRELDVHRAFTTFGVFSTRLYARPDVPLFEKLGAALAIFAIVALLRNSLRSEEIASYAGLIRTNPGIVVATGIVLVSLIGLPPLAGFISKFLVFSSVMEAVSLDAERPLMLVLLVVGGINTVIFEHLDAIRDAIDVLNQYATGNLAPDARRLPGSRAILHESMDAAKASLLAINTQIQALAQAAAAGDFTQRGDATRFDHDFRVMIEHLNTMMQVADGNLSQLSHLLQSIANGDLTARMQGEFRGVFASMRDDANTTVAQLTRIVGRIQQASSSISTAAGEIASGNNDLSRRTEQQAANLEETAASMEELTSTVRQNAEHARQANQLAIGAHTVAATLPTTKPISPSPSACPSPSIGNCPYPSACACPSACPRPCPRPRSGT